MGAHLSYGNTDKGEIRFFPLFLPHCVVGRVSPGVMKVAELSLSIINCSIQEAGPTPHLGITVESALLESDVGVKG